jgi:hypothetical protein
MCQVLSFSMFYRGWNNEKFGLLDSLIVAQRLLGLELSKKPKTLVTLALRAGYPRRTIISRTDRAFDAR